MITLAGLTLLVSACSAVIGTAGCPSRDRPAPAVAPSVLTIGFGLTTGRNAMAGVQQQAVRNIALEGLVSFARNGRPQPWLAESLSESRDHLTWTVKLRPHVTFHNGTPLTAVAVHKVLIKQLPDYLGEAFNDVSGIEAVGEDVIRISMKRRSNFVLEALDVLIQTDGPDPIGTGPFAASPATEDAIEMHAFPDYYAGKALIDRIVIKPYASVRAAWADMLRARVDMLYEVGVDALDAVGPSTETKIFTAPRPYGYVIILNVRRPGLRDKIVRRALNAAIDRQRFVRDGLNGHARPAIGVVWPEHWASDATPYLSYAPRVIADATRPLHLSLLLTDRSHERLALLVQQQLQTVGVEVTVEFVPVDDAIRRVQAGDFDAWFADVIQGPTLLRNYLFWHSKGQFNWTHYNSPAVDAGLDTVRLASTDEAYKAGVAAFERAIADDPPAIFLAWSERARAVNTRFEVPVEPGRDILSTLRLWRPVALAHPAN